MAHLLKYNKKRVSIVIDDDRIYTPHRKRSSLKSMTGSINPAFIIDNEVMNEIHLGHDDSTRKKSITYLKKELEIDYHEIPLSALYKRYGTHPDKGLSSDMIEQNRVKYGKNMLTPPKTTPLWIKFIKTLLGGFQMLLWTGSILSFAAYGAQFTYLESPPMDNLYLACVLAFVVIILGLFTFYQEYSSGKIMESFSNLVPSYACAIRNGELLNVNATDLVVGDLVEVKFGDRIPADLRLIAVSGLKVDNSSLTGESEPQSRSVDCTDENPMETKNLAFFSTNALEGTGKGIVVATGDSTFIGRIAGLASGLDSLSTPLSREVSHFVLLISGVAVFFGLTFFILSFIIGYSWIESSLFLIGIIVANVPEGLLVTFTVILALTAKKMAGKNCLVKQLHAVETLGSTTVICSDKTGTLTQNLMTVSHLWYDNSVVSTDEEKSVDRNNSGFKALSRVASLCLRAKFLSDQDSLPIQKRKVNGDASESAILRMMEVLLGNVEKYQEKNRKAFEIPFNSTNKYQISIHELDNPMEQRYFLVMKGAPERIINYCKTILIGDQEYPLDEDWLYTFSNVCEQIAEMGERVIGFCDMLLPTHEFPKGYNFESDQDCSFLKLGLRFVGLVSMIDPPRPGVPEAVATCRSAGIKVVMVTGDHPTTAKAIARSVGIISKDNETIEEVAKRLHIDPYDVDASSITAAVVNGTRLLEMSIEEIDEILEHNTEIVFARVSPQQKLIIVEAFQRLNQIVAVTGDGVNDSPALKKADIGVAMGIAGSDVSKQAADMILMDDNFASIVSGVEEGRLIFDNLKKCICYLLAANIAELTPFLVFIIFRVPLPMGTIPMLMICLGTDIIPTISLSYEKAEGDIMMRTPRDPQKDKLVTGRLIFYSYGQLGIIESFAGFFTYFVIYGQNGFLADRLLGLASKWDSQAINDLTDSYGQEWTYYDRKQLEHTAWTGFFCSVVVVQWGNLIVSKTRRMPMYTKLFDNWVVYASILFETALACFLAYTPVLNDAISYKPLKIDWWLTPIPFLIFLMVYDETRRFIIRRVPNWKWFHTEFYY